MPGVELSAANNPGSKTERYRPAAGSLYWEDNMRSVKFALAGALFAVGFASPVATAEPDKGSAQLQLDFCKDYADATGATVGFCMGILRGNRGVANTCRNLDENDLLWIIEAIFGEEATNRGQCNKIINKYT